MACLASVRWMRLTSRLRCDCPVDAKRTAPRPRVLGRVSPGVEPDARVGHQAFLMRCTGTHLYALPPTPDPLIKHNDGRNSFHAPRVTARYSRPRLAPERDHTDSARRGPRRRHRSRSNSIRIRRSSSSSNARGGRGTRAVGCVCQVHHGFFLGVAGGRQGGAVHPQGHDLRRRRRPCHRPGRGCTPSHACASRSSDTFFSTFSFYVWGGSLSFSRCLKESP